MTIRPLPLTAAVVIVACTAHPLPAPVVAPPPPIADHRVVLYGDVQLLSRQVRGAHELTSNLGVWHYRVTETKGRVTKIDRVQPSGAIHQTYAITYADDSHTITEANPAGIVLSERIVHDDGLTTIQFRDEGLLDDGCPAMRLTWDDSGARIGAQCLDAQGKSMGDAANCASWSFKRNAVGDMIEDQCTLPAGETPDSKRIMSTHYTVNEYGDTIGTKFFGATGARVASDEGCMGARTAYDQARNPVSTTCLDQADRAIEGDDHVMAERSKYDANGCLIETQWVGASGLVSLPSKPSIVRYARDEYCHELSIENFDAKNARLLTANAPAITRLRLDANFDVAAKTCLGPRQEPVSCIFPEYRDDLGSLMLYRRDTFGRAMSESCFTRGGVPSMCGDDMPHQRRYQYDHHGQMIAQEFFDEQMQPAIRLGKMHRRTFDYDDAGSITVDRSFDVDGKPVVNSLGFSILIYTYDDRHRVTGVEARDLDGKPAAANFCMGAKCFPKGASTLKVVRQHGVHNVYTGPDGKLVSDLDCTKEACWE